MMEPTSSFHPETSQIEDSSGVWETQGWRHFPALAKMSPQWYGNYRFHSEAWGRKKHSHFCLQQEYLAFLLVHITAIRLTLAPRWPHSLRRTFFPCLPPHFSPFRGLSLRPVFKKICMSLTSFQTTQWLGQASEENKAFQGISTRFVFQQPPGVAFCPAHRHLQPSPLWGAFLSQYNRQRGCTWLGYADLTQI